MATIEHPIDISGDTLISLTPVAAAKIRDLLAEEADESLVLRVAIQGGGCSGFQYNLGFDISSKATWSSSRRGWRSSSILQRAVPAGHDDRLPEHDPGVGFKIENPNAVSSCG